MNSCENPESIVLPFERLNDENSNGLETNASCPKSVINSSSKRCYETSDDEDIDFQASKKWVKLNHLKDADKNEKKTFLCEICRSNLEDLNFEERLIHVNQCIDQESGSGLPAVTESSSSSDAIFILECPLCFKNFSTSELRSTHVKKCGKSRGLTVQSVVKALQLQEKHALERKMLGLPLKTMKQAKLQKKPVMKRLIEPKNEQQSDIQLAKALSLSLEEENKKQHIPCEEDIIPLTAVLKAPDDSQNPGRKSKKCKKIIKETPLLLLRTEEERRKILEEKVAAIINPLNMIESNIEDGNTESCSKSLSNQMQVPLLWNLSSKNEEKTVYYVEQLFDWITPSNIETGCKLFNLSQVPGHHIITQIPHDYSFSNSNTDAVLPEHEKTWDSDNSLIDCFQSLVASSYMSDVEIHTASGIVIPAHKLFLSARCPSLKKLLDTTSHEKCVLDWKDVSFDGALQFLNFIYTGNAEWKDDLIAELTSLANKYSVHDLLRQINSNCGSLKTVAEVGVLTSSRIINMDVEINANGMHSAKDRYRSLPVENSNSRAATNLGNENNFPYFEKVFKEDGNLSDCEVVATDKFSQVSNINLEIVSNFIDSSLQPESPANNELNRCETMQNDLSETDEIINQVSEFKSIKEMSKNTATCSTNFSPNHFYNKKSSEINNILLKSKKEQSEMNFSNISDADNLPSDCDEDIAIVGEFSQKTNSQISDVDICERNVMQNSCSALCVQSNSQSINKTFTQDTSPIEIKEHSTYVSYYQNNIQNQTVTMQSSLLVSDLCKSMNKCTKALSPNLEIPIIKDMCKSFDEFNKLQQLSFDNKNGGIITTSSAIDCFLTVKANVANFSADNFKNICRTPNKLISSSNCKKDISSPEIVISDSDEELPAVLIPDSDEDVPVLLDSKKIIENKSVSDADQVIVNRSVSEYSPHRGSSSHNFLHLPSNSNTIELRNNLSPDILICSSDEEGSSDEVKGTVPFAESASCKSDNTDQLYIRSKVCFNVANDELNGKQQICLNVGSNEVPERNQADNEFSKKNEHPFVLNDGKSNERNWMCFDSNETHEKAQISIDSENHELNEKNPICHSSNKEKELPSDLDSSSDDSFLPLSQRIHALAKEDSFQDFQASSKQNNVPKIGTHVSNLKSEKSSTRKKLSEKLMQQKKCNEISHSEKEEKSTPVVQNKCALQFKISDSPITPQPDYKNMVTPDIKQALKNIGVRALPRKKAVALLSRVYDETHPWAEENCVGGEEKSSHNLPASHQTITIKEGMPSDEKLQNKKHRLAMKKMSKEPSRSLSSSSSLEDVLNNPSNSRLHDVVDVCSSQLSDDNLPTSKEDVELLKEYVLSNQELYKKILNYIPINLNDLHEQLKENGIKISNKKLMDYLDEQCIVFTCPRKEEYKKKQQIRSQRFRKRMAAKLSQQG